MGYHAGMDQKALNDLIADAEGLLAKLGELKTPEVQALRDKVQAGIADAKKSLKRPVQWGADQVQEVTESVVQYVRENPWVAVAAGTAIAAALIYIAFAGRSDEDA
jgi:ElaB/YqjD/DUF883 family membrane-anchored ribosome-binding protein